MKNNLKPEQRLDKNGRLVTKHVRAEQQVGKRNALSIPKVFAVKFEMGIFGAGTERESQQVTDMIAHLDQDHLNAFRDIMSKADDQTREQLQSLVIKNSHMAKELGYPPYFDSHVQYAALLMPIFNVIHADNGGYRTGYMKIIEDDVKADLGDRLPENILNGTESEQSLVKGYCIMRQAGLCQSKTDVEKHVDDMEWLGYHADAIMPHFNRLLDMPVFDRELCEAFVNTESPSLSSGLL